MITARVSCLLTVTSIIAMLSLVATLPTPAARAAPPAEGRAQVSDGSACATWGAPAEVCVEAPAGVLMPDTTRHLFSTPERETPTSDGAELDAASERGAAAADTRAIALGREPAAGAAPLAREAATKEAMPDRDAAAGGTTLGRDAPRGAPVARDAPPRTPEERQRTTPSKKVGAGMPLIDLRTATVSELQRLPGIGPSRAEAIVLFRERRPLRSVRDLQRIWGIGPKLLERITPYVTLSSEDPPEPPDSPEPERLPVIAQPGA